MGIRRGGCGGRYVLGGCSGGKGEGDAGLEGARRQVHAQNRGAGRERRDERGLLHDARARRGPRARVPRHPPPACRVQLGSVGKHAHQVPVVCRARRRQDRQLAAQQVLGDAGSDYFRGGGCALRGRAAVGEQRLGDAREQERGARVVDVDAQLEQLARTRQELWRVLLWLGLFTRAAHIIICIN